MYVVYSTEGGYIYEFDSLYWFETNAKARCDEINVRVGDYAYYEEVQLRDPTPDYEMVLTPTYLPKDSKK